MIVCQACIYEFIKWIFSYLFRPAWLLLGEQFRIYFLQLVLIRIFNTHKNLNNHRSCGYLSFTIQGFKTNRLS